MMGRTTPGTTKRQPSQEMISSNDSGFFFERHGTRISFSTCWIANIRSSTPPRIKRRSTTPPKGRAAEREGETYPDVVHLPELVDSVIHRLQPNQTSQINRLQMARENQRGRTRLRGGGPIWEMWIGEGIRGEGRSARHGSGRVGEGVPSRPQRRRRRRR